MALYRLLPDMIGRWSAAGQTEMRRICATDIVSDYAAGFASSSRIQISEMAKKTLCLLSTAEAS